MSCYFPPFKIFISKILIISCFKHFIWKSTYNLRFQRKFSNQRKPCLVKLELHQKSVTKIKFSQGCIFIILSRFLIFLLLEPWISWRVSENIFILALKEILIVRILYSWLIMGNPKWSFFRGDKWEQVRFYPIKQDSRF